MATDLLYDEVTGDLVINDGHPVEISGVEELAQAVRSLLTTPKGTALNEDELGMDMSFLVGGFDEKMAVEAATEAIMQDKRILAVNEITVTPDYKRGVAVFNIAYSSTVGDVGTPQSTTAEVSLDAVNG
ncbi:DUF2634 domain-containing protein [Levilactobacillus brevis]